MKFKNLNIVTEFMRSLKPKDRNYNSGQITVERNWNKEKVPC